MALHQTPSPMGAPGAGVTQGLFYGVPEGACAGAPTEMVLSGGGSVSPPNPGSFRPWAIARAAPCHPSPPGSDG